MIKPIYSTIYSLTRDGVTEVIFLNSVALANIGYDTIRAVELGDIIVKDCLGNIIQPNIAASILNELTSLASEFIKQVNSESLNDAYLRFTIQCNWNISSGLLMISIVRSHMLHVGLSQYGLNSIQMSAKLSSLIGLMQVGMFSESIVVLNSLERDGFLTEERIQQYTAMLMSANAIDD
ncbi:MAG: hypothetical protein WC358_00550 [Ignavibacteria bacterium]|jgi:hypothetical protein